MKKILACITLAFVLWTIMFSPWTAPHLNFWLCMAGSAILLTGLTFAIDGVWWKQLDIPEGKSRYWMENIALGIGIAIVLWGIFWIGDKLSQLMFPSFARGQVNSIYGMKDGFSGIILSLLLLFVIGPSEEIFWRGFIQKRLADHLSHWKTFRVGKLVLDARFWAMIIGVFIYALVHLFSFNFMLIMAALVCGIVWGGLYWLWPNRFPAILLSHALWDAAVFIWFPI